MTTEAHIKAFLAAGGTVTQVPTGVGNELKLGRNPDRDKEDVAIMKQRNRENFIIGRRERIPKPRRYGKR